MGAAIADEAVSSGHTITGKVDIGDDLKAALSESDVVIDFSFHTITQSVFEAAADLGKAVICGTTGHTQEQRAKLLKICQAMPTVWAGNYSIGVNSQDVRILATKCSTSG